MIIFLHW